MARMEMLDGVTLRAVNAYSKTSFAEEPTLLFEFHGSEKGAVSVCGLVRPDGSAGTPCSP